MAPGIGMVGHWLAVQAKGATVWIGALWWVS